MTSVIRGRTKHRAVPYLALVAMGAAWGTSFPITKIAVSTGYKPYGIMVWQLLIGLILSGLITVARGRRLVLERRYFWLFFGISMLGTVVPNYFTYTAAAQLPAGIMAIVIALVPLFAMPIALVLRLDRPSLIRFAGLGMGALAVVLLIGPSAGLPDPSKAVFVVLAMGAPLAYGAEGNFLTWFGARGLDALQILFGACIVGLVVALPLALVSGQFISPLHPWQTPDWAIVASSIVNWLTYAGYVWLIGRAGAVFAAQVAYLVTGFGVVWAMAVLNESYSHWFWLALGLMLTGIFLVQPRDTQRG